MDEIGWAIFFDRVIGIGSILAPIVAGVVTVLVSRRANVDRLRAGFVGTLAAVGLGTAGSFAHGEGIIGALMGSGDIPYHLVAMAWHRMWYPLGISLIVGVALALFVLLPQRPATA